MYVLQPTSAKDCSSHTQLYLEKYHTEYTLSGLLSLPVEILCLVFNSIENAPSQVALALTCKRMALVAKDINLTLSLFSAKYAGYLPREVFDVPTLMKSLRTWVPPTLRLCDHCLTNRPCDREYWKDVEGCESSNFWITKTGWIFANQGWQKQVHNICPHCHVSCSLSDYVDCDGCRALGRLGDVDWSRISDHWKRSRNDLPPPNHWDLTG